VPWVLGNSLAGQTLGVSCLQWALETTPTGIVLAIVAMTPLVVIPLACVSEGEKITARALVGGAIGVAGVVGLALANERLRVAATFNLGLFECLVCLPIFLALPVKLGDTVG